jgi:hypothetical protein
VGELGEPLDHGAQDFVGALPGSALVAGFDDLGQVAIAPLQLGDGVRAAEELCEEVGQDLSGLGEVLRSSRPAAHLKKTDDVVPVDEGSEDDAGETARFLAARGDIRREQRVIISGDHDHGAPGDGRSRRWVLVQPPAVCGRA